MVNIVGVGNVLMGDDGVGPAAVAALEGRFAEGAVRLHDAGLAAADVLSTLDPSDPLVLVDALRTGAPAGTVHRVDLEDVWSAGLGAGRGGVSLHELGALPALRMETLAGREFRNVTVFGVEPGRVEWGMGLSPEVSRGLARLVEAVCGHTDELLAEGLEGAQRT